MSHLDVRDIGIMYLELEAAEHHAQCEIELGPRESVRVSTQLERRVSVYEVTYVIPIQDLVPRPNDTMNLSSGMPSLVFGSPNQRSGMNSRD